MPSPSFEVVTVTPQLAEQMLKANGHNRNIRPRHVAALATDMRLGRWAQNGETIKVAADGTLLDGQHRLHAISAAGIPQQMAIVRNLPRVAQETIDTGARRTFGDVLRLRGEKNYVNLAALTRRVYMWERGLRTNQGNAQPTVPQLLQTLQDHPDMRGSADAGTNLATRLHVGASTCGLSHWLFNRIDPADCEVFFQQLRDGENLSATQPAFVLRRTILEARSEVRQKLSETLLTAYLIKAWNAYREGREMSLLRWRAGGASPEPFPEPV